MKKSRILIIMMSLITMVCVFDSCSKEEESLPAAQEAIFAEAVVADTRKTVFPLIASSYDQYLLPVKIGSQMFNLLVDTGSNAFLVFADKISPENKGIAYTKTKVSKRYASTTREGILAMAEVTIGAFESSQVRLMVIQSPDSKNDPSLTPKKADGIIGMRRTDGLAINIDTVPLDVPLAVLQPDITYFELNLAGNEDSYLAFNNINLMGIVSESFVFRSKTLSLLDPVDKVTLSYSDLQVPFRIKSSYGEDVDPGLDILLDTGAVSDLVLDTRVAEKIGYDSDSKTWRIPEDELIELNILGPSLSLALRPRFKVSEIKVLPYRDMGVQFEAVLGVSRWKPYIISFSYVDFQGGGPDGTISFFERENLSVARQPKQEEVGSLLVSLPGLNTAADEKFPQISSDGQIIVFQSKRKDSQGGLDVYVYKMGEGLLDVPGLNSADDDSDPSVSGNGRYVAFHSNRPGGQGDYDIYLYDLETQVLVELPGLNSKYVERNPSLNADGTLVVFRSERHRSKNDSCYRNIYNPCPSHLYIYDISSGSLSEKLANMNTESLYSFRGDKYDPSISGDGRYVAFEGYGTSKISLASGSDIFLFDTLTQTFIDLPETLITSEASEMTVSISGDGRLLSFTSSRDNPGMGLFDRSIVVYDLEKEIEIFAPGLNSKYDEIAPSFSGDGHFLVFCSDRAGGEGGSDIYVYNIDQVLNN